MKKRNNIKSLSDRDFELVSNIKQILNTRFNNSIDGIYCYGSRITKNNKNSDFDIILVTNDILDWEKEFLYSKIIIDFGIENDIVFDPQFISKADLIKSSFHPYIQEVINTGQII